KNGSLGIDVQILGKEVPECSSRLIREDDGGERSPIPFLNRVQQRQVSNQHNVGQVPGVGFPVSPQLRSRVGGSDTRKRRVTIPLIDRISSLEQRRDRAVRLQ